MFLVSQFEIISVTDQGGSSLDGGVTEKSD